MSESPKQIDKLADAAKRTVSERPEIDTTTPSVARAYDYFLDGKDNFEVDRAVLRAAEEIVPEAKLWALENRAWLTRVVRFIASKTGVDQFLDVGSGLPTRENTHQVAQRSNPKATVVYVDNDPACQAYGRALLEDNERTHLIEADLRRPSELLSHRTVTKNLDFDRPLALIQCGTIHHVADEAGPYEIMQSYIDALPSGSFVALTHFWDPADENPVYSELARRSQQAFRDANLGSGFWRTRAEIQRFFDGLELLEPGLTRLVDWWPDGPLVRELTAADETILGGVGRKP
jgi:hypothetical protein